jgi:hypothetical protein
MHVAASVGYRVLLVGASWVNGFNWTSFGYVFLLLVHVGICPVPISIPGAGQSNISKAQCYTFWGIAVGWSLAACTAQVTFMFVGVPSAWREAFGWVQLQDCEWESNLPTPTRCCFCPPPALTQLAQTPRAPRREWCQDSRDWLTDSVPTIPLFSPFFALRDTVQSQDAILRFVSSAGVQLALLACTVAAISAVRSALSSQANPYPIPRF